MIQNAERFLYQNHIPKNSVGTLFPWKATEEKKYLKKSQDNFIELDIENDSYIMVSNTSNLSDELLRELEKKDVFKLIFQKSNSFVWVKIYQKK